MSRAWKGVLWLVTALVIAPFFLPGWMPFCDLPEHAAAMGSIAHWNDPSYGVHDHFQMGWTTSQYLLLHILGGGLAKVTGSIDLTIRILLIGLAVGWIQSLRFMLRAFGGDERLAILGALLFWNRALVLGFLPYMASLPILFVTLGIFVKEETLRPLSKRSVALAGLGILVFYTHASAFTLLGAIVVALALRQSGVRGAIPRVLWMIPAGLFASVWILRGRFAVSGTSIHEGSEIGTMGPLRAIKVMALWAHDIWTSHVDDALGIAFWLIFLFIVVTQGRSARSGEKRVGVLVPLTIGLAVYLITPFRVGTGVLLNVRMAPVLAVFALLALRPRAGWRGSAPIAVASVLALVQSVDNVSHVRAFQHDVDGVPELLAQMPRGAKLISLNFSGFDANQVHFPPWIYAGSYHRANDGGLASFSFSELPHWSVQYKPGGAPPKQDTLAWAMQPCLYRNVRDGSYFDYVLVRGAVDPFRDGPLGPRWKVTGKTAKFTLYEKDHDREDVTEGTDDGPCRGLRPIGS